MIGRVTKKVRFRITAIGSIAVSAGLWTGLEFGDKLYLGDAGLIGVGLLAALGALGIAWTASGPSSPPHTGSTLRRVTPAFTGRDKQWAEIKAMVPRWWSRKETCLAVVVHGMPGVGKSQFALYAAHKLEAQFGRYARRRHLVMLPRQVPLHGHDDDVPRTDPSSGLRKLLGLDGSNPGLVEMDLDELSAAWRKYLHGKFPILVLDDAHDEAQVEPFLPGDPPYIVLVTARGKLEGLDGVKQYRLGLLTEDEATQLIINLVGRPLQVGDKETIKEIARLCDYHPLAIKLAVRNLAGKSHVSFADRLAQLNEHDNRLLGIDEHTNKETERVAYSFGLSYTQLPHGAKLVLRRLGLAPVPVISEEAATALVGLGADEVTASLKKLDGEALIEESERQGYQLHDLIRHYAKILAVRDDPAENEAAVNRLLAYYWEAAAYADSLLTRQPPPVAIEPPVPTVHHDFSGHPGVIEWVRAELPNLLACAQHVEENAAGSDGYEENSWVVLFAAALAGILRNEGLWSRSIELQTRAVTAAEQIHLPLAVANALSERGMLYRLTGELDSAAADLTQAISIYREVGGAEGRSGEAHALNNSAIVLEQQAKQANQDVQDKKVESQRRLTEALDIYRALNDPLGEANVLHDQGMAEFFEKNYDTAVQLLERALDLYKTVDHPLGMAHAYNNLARAQQSIGDEDAADNLELARVKYGELGNRLGAARVLIRRAEVLRQRDRGEAARALNEALEISKDIGNQSAQIDALDGLGELSVFAGDPDAALGMWSCALKIAKEHGMEREGARLADKVGRVRPGSSFKLRRVAGRIGFLRRWNR